MTRRLSLTAVAAVAALVSAAAFLPALDAGFLNWDDGINIVNNPHYRGLGWAQLKWMFTTTLLGVYAPLAWVTLGVNYAIGGMNPWSYHVGNVLLHAVSVAAFFLVARRLLAAATGGGPRPSSSTLTLGAVVAALAFGVHPLRVESVAWVTERRDVLCGALYLLAVLAYLRGTEGGRRLSGAWLAASLAAFAASLLSKGIAMTLPATLLLLDVYPLRRLALGWRAILVEKVPFALLALLGAVAAYHAAGTGSEWTGYEVHGSGARVAMVAYSFWFYPWKFLGPDRLSPIYELPRRVDPLAWQFLVPIVAVPIVTVALIGMRRRWPGGLAAWAHSAVVVAPVSGFIHAGHQLAHDRWSYLSGLGFAVLAGGGVVWAISQRPAGRLIRSRVALVVSGTGLILLAWGLTTWRQCHVWQTSEALWRAALEVDSACGLCYNNLGAAIVQTPGEGRRRWAEAEASFRHSIALRPDRPDAYLNLGMLLALQRRYRDSEDVFREFMRRWPTAAEGPTKVATLYVEEGRDAEAVPLLRQALRIDPGFVRARTELDQALKRLTP